MIISLCAGSKQETLSWHLNTWREGSSQSEKRMIDDQALIDFKSPTH